MKKQNLLKLLSVVVCLVLVAAMGLALTSCGETESPETPQTPSQNTTTASGMSPTGPADGYGTAPQDVGKGSTSFIFRVTDAEGNDTLFRVYTDKKKVGDALMECGLISGEEGDYGLYVKTVNGITVDYATDKAYWSFYINNEYAMTGVDQTDVVAHAEYCFKVEKG
jgi:hypothetical protein